MGKPLEMRGVFLVHALKGDAIIAPTFGKATTMWQVGAYEKPQNIKGFSPL